MEYDSDSSVEYIGELVASRSLSIAQVTSKGKRRDEEQTRAPRKSGSSEQNRKSVSAASGAEHRTNKVVGLRPPAGGSNGGGGRTDAGNGVRRYFRCTKCSFVAPNPVEIMHHIKKFH